MSYYNKPILLMFLGVPGSGKSYFARQIADNLNAIRLSSDAMRLSIFGSLNYMNKLYQSKKGYILNTYTFGAMNYATEQLLMKGQDVVYDTNHNRRQDRLNLEAMAQKYNAVPVLVYIKTPYEVALKRGQERPEQLDQRRLSESKMREVMDLHLSRMDLPEQPELVIEVDGQLDFKDQFKVFEKSMKEITGNGH